MAGPKSNWFFFILCSDGVCSNKEGLYPQESKHQQLLQKLNVFLVFAQSDGRNFEGGKTMIKRDSIKVIFYLFIFTPLQAFGGATLSFIILSCAIEAFNNNCILYLFTSNS
jgi:hypothetical protein